MRPLITLLTDFGTADGYVGEIKGVLLSRVRDAQVIDLSHDIPPQDVEAARLALARAWRRFPPGTVHLVVVDPGVGSDRAALAIASGDQLLVGPDNGVLSPALLIDGARVVALAVPPNAAATFHGRDVFAPAAARLANGDAVEEIGTPFGAPVLRRTPQAQRRDDGSVLGEIIATDRFGNVITNLVAPRGGMIEIAGRTVGPLGRSYVDAAPGALVAVIGSTGLVEIAVRNGSAAALLGVDRGAPVVLRGPG